MSFNFVLLSVICLVFLFIISAIYLAHGVSGNWMAMTGVLRSLWQKFTGVKSTAPEGAFPNTLEGFGYHFNENGELLDKNGQRFQFMARNDDFNYNQQRYVALGELVTEHVYNVMEKDLKLERVHVPVDAVGGEPRSFIFRSKDAPVNNNLMVLIHGSGAVRAGQWSRKLIINENIDTGSQLPYIRKAISDGFGVIVLNPNLNEVSVDGQAVQIRGSESPEQHGVYVWHHFVQPAKASNIAVVAHSYGGVVACTIASDFLIDWQRRVFSVVFTDSVHMDGGRDTLWHKHVKDFMKQKAINFVSSDKPLNTELMSYEKDDCLQVSAGTPEHERTSHSCIESAFQFMRDNYKIWNKLGNTTPSDYLGQPPKFKSEL